ncbi:DUF421 domain-containing protein [Ornithinicoccus halotolerans]|uniref:DUF421 domain-containing protein n=1 Tax=Ornithinicoccus halotolerans TaxID=1748220 RepID=UPI0012959A5F|nr:YetF domain-containing protein [Ornithinicoccus halotolerans]
MWFDSWSAVLRVLLVGTAAYLTLVVLLRLAGKRTLAKLNAFDFVVTVAIGSVLASAVVSQSVPWASALAGMAVLVVGQVLIARLTVWLPGGRHAVNAQPTLVAARGQVDERAISKHRLTRGEVLQAVRSSGSGGLDQVAAVVLEPDGTLSVVPSSAVGDASALSDVPGWRGEDAGTPG